MAALVIAALLAFLWLRGRPAASPASVATDGAPPAAVAPWPGVREVAGEVEASALHAALHEDVEAIPSEIQVERLETDRPFVCAGETMRLRAVLKPPHLLDGHARWIWPTPTGPGLEPGQTVFWRAPREPGRYPLLFQVCRDLGGRRVGVLAEAQLQVEVRACAETESAENDPLKLVVEERNQGGFDFTAVVEEGRTVGAFHWDFGDGKVESGPEPRRRHSYDLADLADSEERTFVVTVEAEAAGGEILRATGAAFVRGRPGFVPPRILVTVERSRLDPALGKVRTDIVLENPPGKPAIAWDSLERTTLYLDGRVERVTLPVAQALAIEQDLGRGGFRGYVTVDPALVPSDVERIMDRLVGHDTAGERVERYWASFRREAEPGPGLDLMGNDKPSEEPPPSEE